MKQLQEMGFDEKMCLEALVLAAGDMQVYCTLFAFSTVGFGVGVWKPNIFICLEARTSGFDVHVFVTAGCVPFSIGACSTSGSS